ncbi:MFS family permease [Pseudochelatococcus lubricantis]|uniref:MFS family permease n=1 Tax=Pseudochelatococcus lubricantis TaxID=1538102 RepID=A0ABX0UVK6_9HYPH|nr:MFS transporter [Pseudochelatococcus lubricantis]NIJ56978.1 MFS family permease [Pseudochelatococcus lubricantis]
MLVSDDAAAARADRYTAFRHSAFARYWLARFLGSFAIQIVSVSVGWQIYDLTRDPFDLGMVGLVQFLPALVLVLVTGVAADRFGRRTIMGLSLGLEGLCALALLALTLTGLFQPAAVFVTLLWFGIARAFLAPSSASLVVNLVPPEHFANAVSWNASAWQIATIVGPVAGGLLYGLSPVAAYTTAAIMLLTGTVLTFSISAAGQHIVGDKATVDTLLAGFRYIWKEKIVLGAISLDLFAVLLGGTIALLPVYARDVLELGPWGLGMLRAAPGIGAIATALWLTGHPIRDHAGLIMFGCVGLFGLFTAAFGVSTLAWFSIPMLALVGAADMVSVYIRETLLQLWTPDHVRGRVNAVNSVFVGASNELGEFRAGVMAAMIGAMPAVVFGGVGSILVAGLWAWWFPQLRKARHLEGRV